jgi:hypothetical protein
VSEDYPAEDPDLYADIDPPRVSRELRRIGRAIEQHRSDIVPIAQAFADAEAEWKLLKAKAVLRSEQRSAESREAEAMLAHPTEYRYYVAMKAKHDAAKDVGRMLQSQLDAVRSVGVLVKLEYETTNQREG